MIPSIFSRPMRRMIVAGFVVSTTVAALGANRISVQLVPFTLEHTTLARLSPGDDVNVEVDLLAKYAERLASG